MNSSSEDAKDVKDAEGAKDFGEGETNSPCAWPLTEKSEYFLAGPANVTPAV
jgi:hypothetical protein